MRDDESRVLIETDAWGTWVYAPDGDRRIGVQHLWQKHGEQEIRYQHEYHDDVVDERFPLDENQRCALATALWPEGWNDGTTQQWLHTLEVQVEVLTSAAIEAEDALERVLAQDKRMTNKADRVWVRRRLNNLRVVLGDLTPGESS
jgi:hypothetical protein